MISSKEKLNKKNKVGAAFTDDGFAMGLLHLSCCSQVSSNVSVLMLMKALSRHLLLYANATM